jgi:hypothetical protein
LHLELSYLGHKQKLTLRRKRILIFFKLLFEFDLPCI